MGRLVFLLMVLTWAGAANAQSPSAPAETASEPCRVAVVLGVDTIVVIERGVPVTVRLLGIAGTPAQGGAVQPQAAREHLRSLLDGASVRLVSDATGPLVDHRGVRLCYVMREGDQLDVQAALLRAGVAAADTSRTYQRQSEYGEIEREARERAVTQAAASGAIAAEAPAESDASATGTDAQPRVHLTRGSLCFHTIECPLLIAGQTIELPRNEASQAFDPCPRCLGGGVPQTGSLPVPAPAGAGVASTGDVPVQPAVTVPASPGVEGHSCGAMTQAGTPCRRWVVHGEFCYQHRR